MRRRFARNWPELLALWVCLSLAATGAKAQTSVDVDVDVEGYLCQKPVDVRDFQHLAATSPRMTRAAALWRFNRTWEEPRCKWYERTHMIFKGALKHRINDGKALVRDLFVGGAGGIFEVLVYETPDGSETLYSWRRTTENAG